MPGSTIILPGNFGLWSGPGYAGGQIISSGGDPYGILFRQLYGDTSIEGSNPGVRPAGFLDAAPREHDLGYEYADRIYGATLGANGFNPNASKAAVDLVHFVADMDLLKNVFNYKPAEYDFIKAGDKDFIGEYYKDMLVNAFAFRAIAVYGLGPHFHRSKGSETFSFLSE